MRKLILAITIAVVSPLGMAAGGSNENLDPVYINLSDTESLQRGAATFNNYCLSCHSASYMRYNRMGEDLGISDQNLKDNFLFAGNKVGDLMTVSMSEKDSKAWFGVTPPDLTLITRVHKPEWVYTYLRQFYRDSDSPHGWNNKLVPNVAMPHVLYRLQDSMSPEEYDVVVRDLTNFLVYMGEPAKLQRYTIGGLVLLFLSGLFALVFFLKKEYWRDIH